MRDNKHFYMFCPQDECDFTTRLPIQIIDEELYEDPNIAFRNSGQICNATLTDALIILCNRH